MRWSRERTAVVLIALVAAVIPGGHACDAGAQAPVRLEPLWRVAAPGGTSPVSVRDGVAYILESDGTDDAARALDASTGVEKWRTPIGATHAGAELGPRGRPVTTDRHVVAVSSACQVVALDRQSGAIAWRVDLAERFKSRFPARQPCGHSLLAAGDRLIVATGATDADRLVALDASSGAVAWSAAGIPRTLGVTPISLEPGTALVHTITEARVSGLAAVGERDGGVKWVINAPEGLSDAEPVAISPRRVLLQSWSDSRLLEVTGDGAAATASAIWTVKTITANGTPPIAHGATIFGFGGNHGDHLMAVDAASGALRWQQRLFRGSVTRMDDLLVVLSETSGAIRLARAAGDRYAELARLDVLTPGAPAPGPATVHDGVIYARNAEEVAAVRVVR